MTAAICPAAFAGRVGPVKNGKLVLVLRRFSSTYGCRRDCLPFAVHQVQRTRTTKEHLVLRCRAGVVISSARDREVVGLTIQSRILGQETRNVVQPEQRVISLPPRR